ncbi:MAG: ABC transporter permease [Ruminococcus sp.]|nr:ABC transporter permease [Ruminococcus sp.]
MLFFKECKKVFFSVTYFIYLAVMILMFISQYWFDAKITVEKPVEGGDFGCTTVFDAETIMPNATAAFMNDFYNGEFICYPYGFIKKVHPDAFENEKLCSIISEITGYSAAEIEELRNSAAVLEYYEEFSTTPKIQYKFPDLKIAEGMTYEHFCELIDEADDILGGGSSYNSDGLEYYSKEVPITYEEALAEYNEFAEDDKVTGGLARLFCDYLGIDIVLIPVFVAAAFTYTDRKKKISDIIYSRKISSAKLVLTRFAALVVMMLIPVLLMAAAAHIQAAKLYSGTELDNTVFYTLTLEWLLPNLMAATAFGMLITELSSPIIAEILGIAVWFKEVCLGSYELVGDISSFDLIIRHNSEMYRSVFMANYSEFIFSRCFWAGIALVMVTGTIAVYELKRGGVLNEFRLPFKNNKIKSKA